MPFVTFQPSNIKVEIPAGAELLDAARKAGITVEVPCGGKGVCGRCLVQIVSGKVNFTNTGVLPLELAEDGFVLICRTKLKDGDVTVQAGTMLEDEKGHFTNASEDLLLVDRSLLPGEEDLNPLVKTAAFQVPPGTMGDGMSDYDRLEKVVQAELGSPLRLPLELLRTLPEVLRANNGTAALTYHDLNGAVDVIELTAQPGRNYGIAVDIGTTTVAVQLVDMADGTILCSQTDYNGQIQCGLDVISRINYARKPERLTELREKVLETINDLTTQLARQAKVSLNSVTSASIAGNTTMTHLLLGIVPEYIRLEPYTPAVFQPPIYKAGEIGLSINAFAPASLAPAVGSYVGGDITSGLLCTSLSTEADDVCLFIDIGTNGEMVLGNCDFLIGCACSAGPAFEGGGIDHGMRASQGAIEWVKVDAGTGLPAWSTIGKQPPIGICGSGMISLIANLFETGWIDAAGKLDRSRPCAAIEGGKVARYLLTKPEESPKGTAIAISETDIENIIRAKGAIFSACQVMLQKVSMEFSDLSRIYIAGGFGRYLDVRKSVTIGLLPDVPAEKLQFIGNSSVLGAYMTLVSQKHRNKQAELARKITYIDLSAEAEYMDHYTGALFLPHTDSKLFPSVCVKRIMPTT